MKSLDSETPAQNGAPLSRLCVSVKTDIMTWIDTFVKIFWPKHLLGFYCDPDYVNPPPPHHSPPPSLPLPSPFPPPPSTTPPPPLPLLSLSLPPSTTPSPHLGWRCGRGPPGLGTLPVCSRIASTREPPSPPLHPPPSPLLLPPPLHPHSTPTWDDAADAVHQV